MSCRECNPQAFGSQHHDNLLDACLFRKKLGMTTEWHTGFIDDTFMYWTRYQCDKLSAQAAFCSTL